MINNYLDWVKGQRRYCAKSAVQYGRRQREVVDDWSKGFYHGLALAYDYSGQNFKRLQKDIEARVATGKHKISSELYDIAIDDFLS